MVPFSMLPRDFIPTSTTLYVLPARHCSQGSADNSPHELPRRSVLFADEETAAAEELDDWPKVTGGGARIPIECLTPE